MTRSLLTSQKKFNNRLYKNYKMPSLEAAEATAAGISLLGDLHRDTILLPTASKIFNPRPKSSRISNVELRIFQDILTPWIPEDVISAATLYSVANVIIDQQLSLLDNGLTFLDARPSNYWVFSGAVRLVDLGSITMATTHAVQSFFSDFTRHFLIPLAYEKYLNIPACALYQNNGFLLEKASLPLAIHTDINYTILALKNKFKEKLARVIVGGSPEFMEYMVHMSSLNQDVLSLARVADKAKRLRHIVSELIPRFSRRDSEWSDYRSFHPDQYTANKISILRNLLDSKKFLSTSIVDLGSNITGISHPNIVLRVDGDHQVCNQLAKLYPKSNTACLNLAPYFSQSPSNRSALNLYDDARCAIATGILHHLILGSGIKCARFYKHLHEYFDTVLLEYQTKDDPSVKLLLNKRNESVDWSWDTGHLPHIEKYFSILEKSHVSNTRHIYLLSSKSK